MPAKKHNLTHDLGSTFRLAVQYLQPDGETPVDLTDCTAALVRLARAADAEPASSHDAVIDVGTGWITVTVAAATAAEWAPGPWAYRLVVTNAGGEPDVLLVGALTVRTPADV